MNNKEAISGLNSLEARQRLQKLISLDVDEFKGITRQLSRHFVGSSNDAPYIDLLRAKRHKFLLPYCPIVLLPSKAFTGSDRLSRVAERHPHFRLLTCGQGYTLGCRLAFTMAEILISLTIIGIIAAITLPSLVGNINESAWRAQRKALYSRMSQAISMMPSLNGYGEYVASRDEDDSLNISKDTAAEAFVTNGLSKVLNIKNICPHNKLKDCGLPDKYVPMYSNEKKNFPTTLLEMNEYFNNSGFIRDINTKSAGFILQNGESVALFYNPLCQGKMDDRSYYFSQNKMCANFIYDLNGRKGPNKFGKDMGWITAIYPTDSEVISVSPLKTYVTGEHSKINSICHKKDKSSHFTSLEELYTVFYNKNFHYNSTFSSATAGYPVARELYTMSNGNKGALKMISNTGAVVGPEAQNGGNAKICVKMQ